MPRTTTISDDLIRLLAIQHGVVSMQQLAQQGFTANAVQHRVGIGMWRRLLPGVVITTSGQPSRQQLLIGACLWGGPECRVDGPDACMRYGLHERWFREDQVHLAAPETSSLRNRGFVIVRRAAVMEPGPRVLVPYVDAATAVIVATRAAPSFNSAVAVLARALQLNLVSVQDLRTARSCLGDKWCKSVDRALVAVDVGLRSPLEHQHRELILTSRVLPEPLWNQWLDLGDGGGPVCADALWVEAGLVGEVLGKDYHAWGQQFEDTEARRARLVAADLVVQGATASQIRTRQPLLSRLERTYVANAARGLPASVKLIAPPSIAVSLP